MHVINNNVAYFGNFRVEHIPKKIRKLIRDENIIKDIYRIQAYIQFHNMWILSIRFIDFMLKGKSLLDYTNSFSPNDYEKSDKIILKYF